MAKDSPEMEQYSRLLSHLQESCKQKKTEVYEKFIADIAILNSMNRDIVKLVELDLKTILPSILLFSVHDDVNVRTVVVKSFETFNRILNKKSSIKSESWWKDMERNLIPQEFSSHLIKLVEIISDNTWQHIWAFVVSLIVQDDQVHGGAINSLLKVVEMAFKLSRKYETVMEKAYYCWNRLIEVFCVHPKIVTSQKLIELLVRPLSTNLSLKCPKLKLETWNNLLHKVGFACGNTKCKLVIEPFIDFAYLKGSDSLCQMYPVDCITAFVDIVKEKKLYKYCTTKILSALEYVFQSGPSENLNEYIVEIWTAVIDNVREIEKPNQQEYITMLVNKIPVVLQVDRPGLSDALIRVTLENKFFSTDNLKVLILAKEPIMPIISTLMKHNQFQIHFFSPIVNNLVDHFLEAHNKKSQNTIELEIWDLVCEVFIIWLKSLPPPYESKTIESELLCSLLLVPLLSKQWSLPVQKTWSSVLEYTHIIVPSNNYLALFIERFQKELNNSHLSADFAVDFCTFLTNKDKSVFTSLMPIFNLITKLLPSKDPKPLMDLLVLLENSTRFIPKQELIKLLTEMMGNSNSYGQPYDLRIKTKITKLQRKLFTLKDPNEGNKDVDGQLAKSQDKEQPNGQKTRSPLMAQSNFLHRLAKAEEKKSKKRASLSSIFSDVQAQEELETSSPKRIDIDNKSDANSSLKASPTVVKEDRNVSIEEKACEDKNLLSTNKSKVDSPVMKTLLLEKEDDKKKFEEEGTKLNLPLVNKSKADSPSRQTPVVMNENEKEELVGIEEKKLLLVNKSEVHFPAIQTPVAAKENKQEEVKESEKKNLSTVNKSKGNFPLTQTPIVVKENKKEELKGSEEKRLPLIIKSKVDSSPRQLPIEVKENKKESKGEMGEPEEKKLPLVNGKLTPPISPVVTVVTPKMKKTGKSICKPTPPPPSYFEDNAQDYVVVPPKPKNTPLTEHQKEIMSKRRADIPALYQDLSQDTQSLNSQSLKEMVTLKEIKLNDTAKSTDTTIVKDEKEVTSNTSLKVEEETKKKELHDESAIVENGDIMSLNDHETITQPQCETSINLSLTPTKHTSALPTQKNLLNRFNLIESDENNSGKKVDEEDEVEKENKIINVEEVTTPKSAAKRRSLRKSTNKYVTKKTDDLAKTKVKKESISGSSTPNSELTHKGKSKKIAETTLKKKGDSLITTTNNIFGISKKDPDENISLKGSNEIPEIKETEIGNKMGISEVLIKSSEDMSEENNEIELVNKEEVVNNTVIQVKLESPPSLPVECYGSSVVKESSKNTSSAESTAYVEESVKIPMETYGIKTELIKSPVTSLESPSKTVLKTEVLLNSPMNSNISSSMMKEKETDINDISSGLQSPPLVLHLQTTPQEGHVPKTEKILTKIDDDCVVVEDSNKRGAAKCNVDIQNHKSTGDSNSLKAYQSGINYMSESSDTNVGNEEVIVISDQNEIEEEEDDMEINSSGDSNAASWSMATPEKKTRKRRVSEITTDKFSPKILRSKRLSLPKQSANNSAEKSNKKTKTIPTPKNNTKVNKPDGIDKPTEKTQIENKKTLKKLNSSEVTNSTDAPSGIRSPSKHSEVSKSPTHQLEDSGERKTYKRKSQDQLTTPPSQPKKQKIESTSEETSQESLALLKINNPKPRKKKIIKSNMKSSPNNLKQWLIKSGKAVIKTSLLLSSDQSNSQSESKIINNDSEIQISSSEPNKIIVELSPVKDNIIVMPVIVENLIEMKEPLVEIKPTIEAESSPEILSIKVVEELKTVNVPVDSNLSSDDDSIPSVLEPKASLPSVEAEDIESIERQFLDAIKRGAQEEEDNMKRMQEERLKHTNIKQKEEEDEDEEILVESLKCDETEIDRTGAELDRSGNVSRVKLESMMYTKYQTTLKRPRKKKRLIRRVKKDGENDFEEELEEEEETFDDKRERLTTPFRPTSGRSAQMVKMATTEEETPITPVRRRKSILPLQLTDNWPEGRCEQWVPCLPTPPGISPSLGILKRKMSPVVSPSSSPKTSKKKRVSFLDPPVSKGLLYSKGSDNIGQIQHANIPPGKKPLWNGFEGCEPEEVYSSSTPKDQEAGGGLGPVEAEDELTAIQEFLNSTPDTPWKDTPLAGDISKIPGISSCSDPVQNIISRIALPGDEKKLTEELLRFKINTIGGFCSLTVSDIKKLSIRSAKVSTLYNVLKDYFQSQPSSSRKSQPAKCQEDMPKSSDDGENMEFVDTQIEITTLGIEMGVQVDPSEICSDDTFTQMSQKPPEGTQDFCLTPPVGKEVELYSDSQEEIKIPSRDEIGLMFQSEVFIKRAAPFATFGFISKLTAAAADYFGHKPD